MPIPNVIEAGSAFIREGTQLPEALQLESEPYTVGWRLVKNLDRHGLGRKLHKAGWTFSCMASEIDVTVFGLDEQKTVRRAIARTLANAGPEKFNSLEITRVVTAASKRFPGVCYVTASARSRDIQESAILLSDNAVRRPESRKILDDFESGVTVLRGQRASHVEEEAAPEVGVDVCQVIEQRPEELDLEQRDLAAAIVTESHISRGLQNLRDRLRVRLPMLPAPRQRILRQSQPERSVAPMHKCLESNRIEKQMQAHSRKTAIECWTNNEGRQDGKPSVMP
jgi:hypothetical protein